MSLVKQAKWDRLWELTSKSEEEELDDGEKAEVVTITLEIATPYLVEGFLDWVLDNYKKALQKNEDVKDG